MKNLTYIVFKIAPLALALALSANASALGHFSEYSAVESSELIIQGSEPSAHMPLNIRLSQSNNVRSRSDVMREVKQRYNAEVLRIELDEKRMVYRVRVLMPNGKVKNITVSARR